MRKSSLTGGGSVRGGGESRMLRKATIIEHKTYPVFLSSQGKELSCYTVLTRIIFPFGHESRKTLHECVNGFTTSCKRTVFMLIFVFVPTLP